MLLSQLPLLLLTLSSSLVLLTLSSLVLLLLVLLLLTLSSSLLLLLPMGYGTLESDLISTGMSWLLLTLGLKDELSND